jgi:hypothetical protein
MVWLQSLATRQATIQRLERSTQVRINAGVFTPYKGKEFILLNHSYWLGRLRRLRQALTCFSDAWQLGQVIGIPFFLPHPLSLATP